MKARFNRPGSAMMVAMVALGIAAGGDAVARDAYAAAKKLISGKTIKKNSIPANRLTASARRQLKGNSGLPGSPGAAGAQGPQGPPGSPDTSAFYDKAASDARFLGMTAKASDADMLDGVDSAGFLAAGGKAADAETVDGVDSSALARVGKTIVTVPGTEWQPFDSSHPLTVTRFTTGPAWTRTAAGSSAFVLGLTVPTASNGKRQRLDAIRYCYDANASQVLTVIFFEVFRHADNNSATTPLFVNDPTDRTDAACRTYTPTNQVTLQGNDSVELYAEVNYAAAGPFVFGPVSLELTPTSTDATLAARSAARAEATPSGQGGTP